MALSRQTNAAVRLIGFVAPALAVYAAIVLVPAVGGIWYSFTNWNGLNPTYRFVGFRNYLEALGEDEYFIASLLFTLRYVGFMVVLQNTFALALALLVEGCRRGRLVFRTLLFLPNMISMIIGGFIWLFMFTRVLTRLNPDGVLGFLNQSWIGDPRWSFVAILSVSLWAGVGYLMVIYIAGLQNVPRQLLEAAAIDGAGRIRVARYVILPMIMPAVTIGIFLSLNMSFKVFDVVYALTGGGPGRATQVVALNIFEEAFSMSNRYGYASAKATLLFLVVFLITLIQLRMMKKREIEA